jgi:tetratricopeptide (TPR) repeat protein
MYYENDNIVELEEQIVASLIRTFPSAIERESRIISVEEPVNPEAKVHYMKGRALSYGSTQKEAERALDHFREAIEIDPDFAPAYVAIANEKIIQAMFSTASREEIFNEARTAVQTALALDPNSAEAYYVDGAIEFYGEFDWDAAEESYKKSIEINPGNANAYIRYSAFLAAMKRFDESIALADKAMVLDPISISSLHNLGWVHLLARNFEESEAAFTEALDLHPNWIWGYVKRGYSRMYQGKCELAQADVVRARELVGGWSSELLESTFIFVYSRCGNEPMASELIERFFARVNEDNYKDPFAVFFVHYLNGDLETALDWAERCLEEKEASSYLFNADIFYKEDMMNHPRFIQIRKTLKFEN